MVSFAESDAWVVDQLPAVGSSLFPDESFYRTLVEHTLDVVTVIDRTAAILFSSSSVETVLGYSPLELIGRNVFEFVHHDDLAHTREVLEAALRTGAPAGPVQYRCRHRDGRWLILESVGRFETNLAGQAVGVVNSRDVTERAQLEERFRRAQRLEVFGRMTAALTHDFNNLLTIIGGHANLLETSHGTSSSRSSVGEIRSAVDRASALTKQLLTYARHGTTTTAPWSPVVDANEVVADLAGLFDRLIGKGVRLACTLGSVHPMVAIDRSRLDQLLINLVVNASDAVTNNGTITVVTRDAAAGETTVAGFAASHLVIEVTDSGSGMTSEVLAHIFEPFFTTKPAGKGTGLGLSTVAEIVEEARGVIDVETAEGRGSTFRIRLARAQGLIQ